MPIVASSTRASTLHYCCNDKAFAWGPVGAKDHVNSGHLAHTHPGEGKTRVRHGAFPWAHIEPDEHYSQKTFVPQVLLIDAGCEWNCHAADSKLVVV